MTTVVKVTPRKPNFDVYIGRAWAGLPESKWHNPYRIGVHGTREQVLERYEMYIRRRPDLIKALPELRDKRLGCWCHPLPCHGDVLVRLIDEFVGKCNLC
jgi:hypothetical protein